MDLVIEKGGKPVGSVSHRRDGDYKKLQDGTWQKVTEPKQEGTGLKNLSPEKINEYQNNTYARTLEDVGIEFGDKLPDNVYLHGSKYEEGEFKLDDTMSFYATKDWDVAENYGDMDKIKVIQITDNASVIDLSTEEGRQRLVGILKEANPDISTDTLDEVDLHILGISDETEYANLLYDAGIDIIKDSFGNIDVTDNSGLETYIPELNKPSNKNQEKSMGQTIGKEIKFHFHPNDFEHKGHVIEKDEGGKKRRYLGGISSGLKLDAHGERMTDKCIKSFMNQASSGEILLYPDIHGIKESEDIGKLIKAQIMPNGDWYTEYRLYDTDDGIGPMKAEKIDTLWKQLNGIPPYGKPRQKGFSIEGIIPDENIIYDSYGDQERGVLDDVLLDGVVLVPRPAYKDSIATAIYKAFGETTPQRQESLKISLVQNIQREQIENAFYKVKWEYQDALEGTIEKIMRKTNNNKLEELNLIFDEYKGLMIELIMKSASVFADEQPAEEQTEMIEDNTVLESVNPKLRLYKSLLTELKKLDKVMEK